MKINVESCKECAKIEINGNIRSYRSTQDVISIIADITDNIKRVEISIKDSHTVSSMFVGFLIQQVKQNNVAIYLKLFDENLYSLFDILDLSETLNVSLAS